MHEIVLANSIFPALTDEELRERMEHQRLAIGHNAWISTLLRITMNDIPSIDANKIENILALTRQLNTLLRAWKKASRKQNNAPKGAE